MRHGFRVSGFGIQGSWFGMPVPLACAARLCRSPVPLACACACACACAARLCRSPVPLACACAARLCHAGTKKRPQDAGTKKPASLSRSGLRACGLG
jgi:hypothetical protein